MPSAELATVKSHTALMQAEIEHSSSSASSSATTDPTRICSACCTVLPGSKSSQSSGSLICNSCSMAMGDGSYCANHLIDIRSNSSWKPTEYSTEVEDTKSLLMTAAALASLRKATTIQTESEAIMKTPTSTTRALKSRTHTKANIQRHEMNLLHAFMEITTMCNNMDLPKHAIEATKQLYRIVEEKHLYRGKSKQTIMATCVFISCRQQCIPRTFKEICSITNVSCKDIGRTFKYLKAKLNTDFGYITSEDLLDRFCSNLSLLSTPQRCAQLLNQKAKERDTLAGKSPVSVAGACIYMASHLVGQPRDTKVISHVAGISEVTIKNSYKLLFADRNHLVTEQILAIDPMASLDSLPLP